MTKKEYIDALIIHTWAWYTNTLMTRDQINKRNLPLHRKKGYGSDYTIIGGVHICEGK